MHFTKNREIIAEKISSFINCDCSIESGDDVKPITFFHWDALSVVNKIEFLSETFHGCNVKETCAHLFKIIEEETEFGTISAPIEFHPQWMPIGMVGEPVYSDALDELYSDGLFQLLMVNLEESEEGFPLYTIDIREERAELPIPFLSSFLDLRVVKAG